jgi:hypothetical protein
MGAFFSYSSRDRMAIDGLTRALEGARADFALTCAKAFGRPVPAVPRSVGPRRAHGPTPG